MAQQFTETERAILRIVQADLPDSLTPYADIARTVGCTEEEVLDLLSRLKQSGAIRRFGASIKHQKTGWNHNALITMTKNENYHDAENVSMNHIRFFLSDDRDLMRTNFLAGTWQLIDELPADEIETLKTEFPGEFTAVGQSGTCYLTWNINEPLLPEA